MTDLAMMPSQRAATLPREECSSEESKAAKRPRRAANAARELVQDIAQTEDSDSDGGEPQPRAKSAKKSAAATAGADARPKLPRPEGIACCPRCSSEDTKFCYYNNYNIKQPRFFCKGCQRYWTDGGMLRNVPVGSGRRKNKNSVAREAEKAATADAAKQQNIIAAGAYEQFRHLLMDSSLAYTSGSIIPGAGPAKQDGVAAVSLNQATGPALPPPTVMGSFTMFPQMGMHSMAFNSIKDLGASEGKHSNAATATMALLNPLHALLGGPVSVAASGSGLCGVSTLRGSALPGPGSEAAVSATPGIALTQGLPTSGSKHLFGVAMGPSAAQINSSTQMDWTKMAASGQMQAAVVAQQQLQQAAALQAQAHLQAAAATFGQHQQQNPYMNGIWPYNMYPAGPNWAAAAYARLGQQQSWQSGDVGAMQSVSSEATGSIQHGAAVSAAAGASAASPAALLGAPMWSQQWSAPGAGVWGPMGGVPVSATATAAFDNAIFSTGTGSILSGASNVSSATLLGKSPLVRLD